MKYYKGGMNYSKMIKPLLYIERYPEMTPDELAEVQKEITANKAPPASNVIHFDFKNRTKL